MKTIQTIGAAVLLLSVAYSCKNGEQNESALAEDSALAQTSAASTKNDNGRKIIRTADMKFKVSDVTKSTYAIENTVNKFGGMVTNTNLQSVISQREETQVSPDSTLETTRFTVENNMTFRVPNHALDTVVKSIAKEVKHLDFRVIKAEDAGLQFVANDLTQTRNGAHKTRLENAVSDQPRKLNDITATENQIIATQEAADNAKIENLALNDKVLFSTVTLALYEGEKVRQELIANEKSMNAYRPHIGLQIWDSLKTGWFILEGILAFIAKLWSLILIGIVLIFIYRKYGRKVKPAL